jgi:hypothetical protein
VGSAAAALRFSQFGQPLSGNPVCARQLSNRSVGDTVAFRPQVPWQVLNRPPWCLFRPFRRKSARCGYLVQNVINVRPVPLTSSPVLSTCSIVIAFNAAAVWVPRQFKISYRLGGIFGSLYSVYFIGLTNFVECGVSAFWALQAQPCWQSLPQTAVRPP